MKPTNQNLFLKYFIFSLPFLLIIGCKQSNNATKFFHDMNTVSTPWTHERFDNNSNKFTFAIISDLWGGERPGVIDVAIEQVNLLRPEFIMSVGDLIDGGTEDTLNLKEEWNEFDNKSSKAIAPMFYTGGNHDLTNTTMRDVWEKRHGKRYYHFKYNNVLFLVLDSEDYEDERMQEIYEARAIAIEIMDSNEPAKAIESLYFKMPERRTGEISAEQSKYFEQVIKENSDVRWTFLFMHKPVWMRDDSSGLNTIETALGIMPYTVINGHFHVYNHTERKGKDYITLATTGGAQNDKSDMAFDHFTMVTMTDDGPSIASLRLDGVLDKYGAIPLNGDTLCFQASRCVKELEDLK